MSNQPGAVLVSRDNGGWRVACTCGDFGWWQINDLQRPEFLAIEQHGSVCPLFISEAHHQIDGLAVILGQPVPEPVRQLLRDLLDTPAAGFVMRWLADLEDRADD